MKRTELRTLIRNNAGSRGFDGTWRKNEGQSNIMVQGLLMEDTTEIEQ